MKKNFGAVSPEFYKKLQATDPDIQQYVIELVSEIANLQKKNISLEVKNVSFNERINALESELKQYKPGAWEMRMAKLEEVKNLIEKSKSNNPV